MTHVWTCSEGVEIRKITSDNDPGVTNVIKPIFIAAQIFNAEVHIYSINANARTINPDYQLLDVLWAKYTYKLQMESN